MVHQELKRLRENALTSTALHRAKEQFKGQFALAQEGGVNMMLALGKSLISKDVVVTTKSLMEKIDGVTTSEILEVANTCFDEKKLSTLIYR